SVVKLSSVFSVVLLVLVAIYAVYMVYTVNQIKSATRQHEQNIANHRKDINSLKEIEILARSLDGRYKLLSEVLDKRQNYSILLEEITKRMPVTTRIDSWNISAPGTVMISGVADDYLAIAKLLDNMSQKDFVDAGEGMESLLTDITLNSVQLDNQDTDVSFALTVKYDSKLISGVRK
ncbi:MAG TPA: PilN domain-containing protein, partial [bacterium]|nr:PilN domain-containing protein [bacterium]